MIPKTEFEQLLAHLGLTVTKLDNRPANLGWHAVDLLHGHLFKPTLCVQLQDQDGTDFFYNTTVAEGGRLPDAVKQAYDQHVAEWDDPDYEPDPSDYDIVRVFAGRFDGYNLVDFDNPKSVQEHLACSS